MEPSVAGEDCVFTSIRGSRQLYSEGYSYSKLRTMKNQESQWKCATYRRFKCRARVWTTGLQGVPKIVKMKPPHNHPPNAVEREATVVRCQIRERCLREPDLRPIDVFHEVMATCTPEVRAYLARQLATIRRDVQRTRAFGVGGDLPRPVKRKNSQDPDKMKKAKTQNTADDAATSGGNQSSHIPEYLGSGSELPPSMRNKDTYPQIKEEGIKDELMLEDYNNSDGALGETYFEESVSNENAMEDSNVYASTSTDAPVPFETVVCNGGIQVKQEIVEDETGDFEMAHEPESVSTTLKSTGAANTTEPSCSGYSENAGEIASIDALAILTNTLGTTNEPSQDTGTLGYMVTSDVQTVATSQPLVIGATPPNYIGVVMSDSYTVTNYSAATATNYNMAAATNFSTAFTANYSADAATTNFHAAIPRPTSFTTLPAISATHASAINTTNQSPISATNASAISTTKPSPISATNAPGQPPRDESSSCTSGCEELEGVFISLKKVPTERRKKTKDKLLRLVKLITELDLDPDEVSFSVTTK